MFKFYRTRFVIFGAVLLSCDFEVHWSSPTQHWVWRSQHWLNVFTVTGGRGPG